MNRVSATNLELRSVELVCCPRKLLKVDLWRDLHLTRVDSGTFESLWSVAVQSLMRS